MLDKFLVYRSLYNATVGTFPGAFMILTAAATFLASILNLYLYTQRHRMKGFNFNQHSTSKENGKERLSETTEIPSELDSTYF